MTEPVPPLFEIAPREDTRYPVAGRPARPWRSIGSVLPAAVLVCLMVVAPLVYTVVTSLWVGRGAGLAGTGFGFGHYAAIWYDPQVRHAVANSLRWLAVAPLVCLIGFVLARIGRDARRSRAFLIGVIAAPMAVSALITGITFRLMFAPQPTQGVMTAIASAADNWLGGTAPLPGGRPDPDGTLFVHQSGDPADAPAGPLFSVDPVTGDLVTATVTPGQVVDLALTGVPTPPGPALAADALPRRRAGQVSGVVTVRGRPVAGVPVSIHRLAFAETTRTDRRGVFAFDVADQPVAAEARYVLHIPASAVAPPSNGVAFLGPSWIGWVLAAAFVWGWTGYAVVVFRAGLAAVPRDLLRMARALGAGRVRTAFAVTVPALIPVTAVVLLTLLVAAVRVFDLVLVAAPGSVQANADVIGLHWWRSQSALGDGGAAALAVLLFALVAVFALAVLWGLNREWPMSPEVHPPGTRTRRWPRWLVGGVVVALWLVPFVTLVLTSLRSNRDAAVAGWWVPGRDGLGLDSYRAAFAGGELGSVLWATGVRATLSTAVLVVLAVPAAHALAGGAFPARVQRVLVTVTAVLAVVPVQAVASPLEKAFNVLHLSGSPALLTIIHVAFGVPFAVLLLRPAFRVALRGSPGRRPGRTGERAQLLDRRVLGQVWPSVLAVAVLEFVFVWNDLVVSLILSGPQSGSIMLTLFGQVRNFATSSGVLAASGVVSMAVPLVLVLVTGRWVVRGLAAGVAR